jgi:hypothetical protein
MVGGGKGPRGTTTHIFLSICDTQIFCYLLGEHKINAKIIKVGLCLFFTYRKCLI